MKYRIAGRKRDDGSRRRLLAGAFALVFGGVGFICGVVGPVYLDPVSNLHSMQGYFVTGPGGVLAGVVVGSRAARRRLHPLACLRRLAIGSLLVALASILLSLP